MFGTDVSNDVFLWIMGMSLVIGWGAMWWRILSKTGYAGALGLLMFVPVVNLILLAHLAIADWPIERRLGGIESERRMRHGAEDRP
jgi:hypothetical protein